MLKRILCILMVCVLLTLAGCGTVDTPSTQPNMENSTPGTAPTDSTAPSSSQTQQTEPGSTATEATEPTEATNATEPTETEPTEPTVETVPVRPQGTVYITAPLDIFAETPENAGDVEMDIVDGYLFVREIAHDWSHWYTGVLGNHQEIFVVPSVQIADLQEMTILYEARTNWDGFYTSAINKSEHYAGQQVTFENHVCWVPAYETEENPMPEQIWIDVVIYANGNIVGMAVYEVDITPERRFHLVFLYSEGYEMIDGEFQYISEEFVNARIEAYHQYALGNRRES